MELSRIFCSRSAAHRLLALQPAHLLRRPRLVLRRLLPTRGQLLLLLAQPLRERGELNGERLILLEELRARRVAHVSRVLQHQLQLLRVAVLCAHMHVQLAQVAPVRLSLPADALNHEVVGLVLMVGHVGGGLNFRKLCLKCRNLRSVIILVRL